MSVALEGLDAYERQLSKIGKAGLGVMKSAVYVGMDELANAVRAELEAMPTEKYGDTMRDWRERKPYDGLTAEQKEDLLDSMYTSSIKEDDGFVYTQIGFAGYNRVSTWKHPEGQPNAMLARSLESGSSVRKKHPFVRPAVNRVRQAAIMRMAKHIEKVFDEIMKSEN